jgi:Cdc6-like AAA superfamily ATPase
LEREGNEYPFSADRPINSGGEDLLGRAKFAASLGKAIKSWRGKDSLVIALYGPWGSGKSSVKNLVLESLRSSLSDCPSILEFNPWQLASQSQITEAFFSEVGTALGRADTSADATRLAAKFYAYGRYLWGPWPNKISLYSFGEHWPAAAQPHRKNGGPLRLGRGGKLELTEALRSNDRN